LALVNKDGLALVDSARPMIRVGNEDDDFLNHPDLVLDVLGHRFPDRTIWVAGGTRIYAAFARHCQRFDIGLIDYDGEADAFFPPMPWEAATRAIVSWPWQAD
jgi:dihydrofolate reductase